ncbi:MAG: Nramp family divalent metal transporter [Alphaproteobacteria bacterium]
MSLLPRTPTTSFNPSEVTGSVHVPMAAPAWRKALMVCGPALLVSVGYVDPGNWATDLAAGTQFGYDLLCIIFLSNIAAIFLQTLTMRVGVVTGKDIARLSRDTFPRHLNIFFWLLAELAIIACDIAEVLGSALALHLLFGCSIATGIVITALDTVIVLGLRGRGYRQIEAIILGLLLTIGICFTAELIIASPDWPEVFKHVVPSFEAVGSSERLYLAIGIIGATVMPHNLYLHSSLVQTRKFEQHDAARKDIIFFNTIDTAVALFVAFLINAAILILSAAAFHGTDAAQNVTGIEDAYKLLEPVLGSTFAMYAFGISLWASGQSSTFTGTIAGQVILEGYMQFKIPAWIRRFITRGLALIPALIGVLILGDKGVDWLLVLSQVILGLQLPFVIYPLLRFASNKNLMGAFVAGWKTQAAAWLLFSVLTCANLWLLYQLAFES